MKNCASVVRGVILCEMPAPEEPPVRIVVTGSLAIDHLVVFLGRQLVRMDEAAMFGAGYGLAAAAQVEPHLPAAVSDAGTVR
jgi:hypothetical protein